MHSTTLKRSFVTLAAVGATLALAGPAGAVISYNGHAGLGSNIRDGTSNTIMVGESRGADRVLMADMGGQFRAARG
jgi:hypothetical protein